MHPPDHAVNGAPRLETERLLLRELHAGDSAFILELLNEPGWLRYIGDRGIRTLDAARQYILNGPVAMYDRLGFGLYAVIGKQGGEPLGICGLIKRDSLDDVDIGFAFLARHAGQGYAVESASAVLDHARRAMGLRRVVAITTVDNEPSIRLLEKIGLRFERMIRLAGNDEDVRLFSTGEAPAAPA